MDSLFHRAGFSKIEFVPNMWATDEYLSDFVPRLRACPESPYYETSVERLCVTGGQYFTVK
jgi:hypothetical protein